MDGLKEDRSIRLPNRADVEQLFEGMRAYLNANLPGVDDVAEEIRRAKKEYEDTKNPSAQSYEVPFFKKHVIPAVHHFLIKRGLEKQAAIQALLAEGYSELKDYASGSPASKEIYPYKKTIAATLKSARKDWWKNGKVLSSSCPDLAICLPGGPNIVFEGKLFRSGGPDAAKSAIVAGIYECFFYRALPTLLHGKERNASSYDFACFLAYDASPRQSLLGAWQEINQDVERSCWEALNIYVMIVRNDNPPKAIE